jgi:anti-sigma regulatory factor (Ser/Thr protein kinase)
MGQPHSWWHQAAMPGEAVSVLRARRFVCVHLVEHRLLYLVDDVRLVVSELAANAVRHAHSPFTVSLGQADRAVILSVQDGSPDAPVLLATQFLDTAGRGVFIVDLVSDEWGVTQAPGRGKSVWASFSTR